MTKTNKERRWLRDHCDLLRRVLDPWYNIVANSVRFGAVVSCDQGDFLAVSQKEA